MTPRVWRYTPLAAGLVLACLAGCAGTSQQVNRARQLYYAGDMEQAAELLEREREAARGQADVIALDLAMSQLFAGQTNEAEQTLRAVRDRFDYLEQKDVAETALTYVTDDTRRAYAGEDYEKILIRVMLAMTNLMNQGLDAEAYSLQVNAKQQEIIEAGVPLADENPKEAYRRVAFGAYLHGVLREATHSNYDDVERSFTKVVSWQPGFTSAQSDLQRARQGIHSARGNGVLYVFAFVGRGPYKRQTSEVPTSQALLIADRIISAAGDHSLPPTIMPIQVPVVVTSENAIQHVLVDVGGAPAGATETITDVGQLAVQQNEAVYSHIVARAVARRAIKKAAVYAVKDHVDVSGGWADLALTAAGVVWEATETADTRCWSLLPDRIQVLRVELPAGEHTVALRAGAGTQPLGPPREATVRVEDGRNTYLLVCLPQDRAVGEILVSGGP
jgi:hypothetical protein